LDGALNRIEIADIARHKFDFRSDCRFIQPATAARRIVVNERPHALTSPHELFSQMRADETSRAGDQNHAISAYTFSIASTFRSKLQRAANSIA
jgi:uncharacterized protein (UPF0305 family)